LDTVVARVREVLRLPPDQELPVEVPLAERGFDSLMATELKTALLSDGIDVPLGRLLGGPSPGEIAAMAVARRADVADERPALSDARLLLWTHAAVAAVAAAFASAVWALVQLY
jgi:hypothetical protein